MRYGLKAWMQYSRWGLTYKAIRSSYNLFSWNSYGLFLGLVINQQDNSWEGQKFIELQVTKQERDLGVITTSNLKSSEQCSKPVAKATSILRIIRRNFKKISLAGLESKYLCKPIWPSVRSRGVPPCQGGEAPLELMSFSKQDTYFAMKLVTKLPAKANMRSQSKQYSARYCSSCIRNFRGYI